MRAILDVWLETPDSSGHWRTQGYARKTLDLSFAPHVGMEIEDSAWKQAKSVLKVSLIVDEDNASLYITLGGERYDTRESLERALELYSQHGWVTKGS